jgi:acyl-CoA reductase-like NAD-dependent aldehyde dehydrogenase
VESRLHNSGQDHLCPDVLLVHRKRAGEFVERLVRRIAAMRLGESTDLDADYTPLFDDGSASAVERLLRVRANHVVHRGVVDERTRTVAPAVLACDISEPYQVRAIFAPVFDIRTYENEAQITRWLRAVPRYERALGATVIGADAVADELEQRHWVVRERSLFAAVNRNEPFGGLGLKASHLRFDGHVDRRPLLVSREVAAVLGRAS